MGARPNTLADAINMATRFDEDFTHNQEVRRKKEKIVPPMKLKKVIFIFKRLQKPQYRPLGKRPPQPQGQSQFLTQY